VLAIGLDYATKQLAERELPEPAITGPEQVLYRVREVGVCGTDRELARFAFGHPPAGEEFLALGHEAVGEIVAKGPAVRGLQRGDLVVPTIRRACPGPCGPCGAGRRDLCQTGGYRERGIFGLHGFMADLAVDSVRDLVPVPAALASYAILVEPLSSVEKVVESVFRCHQADPQTALVLGAGPIGILTALRLQLQGMKVTVQSLEPEDDPRVVLLRQAGVRYEWQGRDPADLVIEATGSPDAGFIGLNRLAPNGVLGLLGARDGHGTIRWLDMIRNNQTVVGSVNASLSHFKRGVKTLSMLERRTLNGLVTRARRADFRETIYHPPATAIKVAHVLTE
jgi:threonine dehydrogenase-like Zn-dependent dehydrogenase